MGWDGRQGCYEDHIRLFFSLTWESSGMSAFTVSDSLPGPLNPHQVKRGDPVAG